MENRNRLPLRKRGSKTRGMQVGRLGRKTEQVIDDDMNRAADRIRRNPGEIKRFGPDALARERRISVQDNRKNFPEAAGVPEARLFGPRPADDDGVDSFEMAGFDAR